MKQPATKPIRPVSKPAECNNYVGEYGNQYYSVPCVKDWAGFSIDIGANTNDWTFLKGNNATFPDTQIWTVAMNGKLINKLSSKTTGQSIIGQKDASDSGKLNSN